MKIIFFSFGFLFLLASAIFGPTNAHAYERKMDIIPDQSEINFDNDYPSYAARIKRFHHAEEGLDYFAPNYTGEIDNLPKYDYKVNRYKASPYKFQNFAFWARLQASDVIWRYANDKIYQRFIDDWNNTKNPFWTYAITESCPFGTFDFTGGAIAFRQKDGNPIITRNRLNYFDYSPFSYYRNKRSFRFGLLATGSNSYWYDRSITDNKSNAVFGIKKLPTRQPQQTVVQQSTTEKLNFTEHISLNIEWKRGMGISNGYNRYETKWDKGKVTSNTDFYDSQNNRRTFIEENKSSTKSNIDYYKLSTKSKSTNISTNNSNSNTKSKSKSKPSYHKEKAVKINNN